MLERDAKLRHELENAHGYFTTSTNMLGELLAELATRNREIIWNRARSTSGPNLALLDEWAASNEEHIEWLRPSGSMTAFPRLRGVRDARPFCVAAAERGVLVAIGEAFGAPAHFRIGFGLAMPRYAEALDTLSQVLAAQSWR
jgi:aspartate/methionine/tyrosine aminotransferase